VHNAAKLLTLADEYASKILRDRANR